jgi:seryl-tRNA synthetase
MLQISYIRQNSEEVKRRLSIKNFAEIKLVDEIIETDDELRAVKQETELIQSKIKKLSEEIGMLIRKGQADEGEEKKREVEPLKLNLSVSQERMIGLEKKLDDALVKLPNLPSAEVPAGKTPEDNVTVKEGGEKPTLPSGAKPHWELAKQYRLIDFELGNKVTGSGFPFYTGKGAKFQRALIQYFLDFNTAAGYIEYSPPFVVNEDSAYGTGQLPDKEGQMYHVAVDNFYMIPTAEVPVTNIYRNEILKDDDLPVKMTAYTPCFRREAGSYGKDVRGLNRLHQFDKVELVQLTDPAKSYNALQEMVDHVERLVKSLGLPYRILKLCGGDMSFASALTFDFEVFSAAQEKWLEVSSVSNFETFQTNRMKIRYKARGGKTQLVHSLNGSSLALPRIVAALLENNQGAEGIKVPEAVQKYFGNDIIN